MHPILFEFPAWLPLIGERAIHVYGFLIAMAFLFGMWWVKREALRLHLDVDRYMDIFFYLLISGLVGARLFFVFHSVTGFWQDPLMFFRVWEGGLVFQGGVILCVIVGYFYVRKYKMSFFVTGDVYAPALALGHGIGRVGCFFAGCCFGKQCSIDYPFAVVFPYLPDGIAPPGIPLYPTQLIEFLGEVVIFTILVFYRKKKPFDGAVFLLYIILYSILRSIIEIYRGDVTRGFVIDPYLSHGQFVGLVSIIIAVFCWVYKSKQKRLAQSVK